MKGEEQEEVEVEFRRSTSTVNWLRGPPDFVLQCGVTRLGLRATDTVVGHTSPERRGPWSSS